MRKELVICILVLFLIVPVSATLASKMDEVQSYVNQYKAGSLDAAKLIVHIDYIQNKMYEELDKQGQKAFTETEIVAAFDKKQTNEYEKWLEQYEKRFITPDFHIVFNAYSFYRHDKEYYEQRAELELFFVINYEVEPVKWVVDEGDIGAKIKNFLSNLKSFSNLEYDKDEFEILREQMSDIRSTIWEIKERDDCREIMSSAGLTEFEDAWDKGRYDYKIKETTQQNCWDNPKCDQVCSDVKRCPDDCTPSCYNETSCITGVCEDIFNNETNSTESVCEDDVCLEQESCSGCECWIESQCDQVCVDAQQCDEWVEGELKIEANCRKEGSDFFISAWGPNLDYYQELNNNYGKNNCGGDLEGLVNLRKIFQKSINDEFVKWYFEEYLAGSDYDKILNGDQGFKRVLEVLTRNEEDILNTLQCEQQEWPSGFENIDITYVNDNTHVEVWEKMILIQGHSEKVYTTLYKYSWIPSKELLKELIDYKLSETGTFGPSARDVASIKQDQGQMALVYALSEKYGGSFDVKLELIDNEDVIIVKYLQVNPDVAVKIGDELDEKPDISIKIDYDVLYNFISYMNYEIDGGRIYGPHWVWVEGGDGPENFFGMIGAVSKMWREGITIKPRQALLKLLFNSKNLIGLIGNGADGEVVQRGELLTPTITKAESGRI